MSDLRQRRPLAPSRSSKDVVTAAVKVMSFAIAAVLILGACFAGWRFYSLSSSLSSGNDLTLGSTISTDSPKVADVTEPTDGAIDILLVGSDSRTDAQGNPLSEEEIEMLRAGDIQNVNTDTIIVARIDAKNSTITAVSIPRDTYITDRTFGNMKINAVYGSHVAKARQELSSQGDDIEADAIAAGRQALIEAVGTLTGIVVDRYAEVGLLGFVLLTDAVGGVDVCLNNAVDEPLSGARFGAGPQTINGADGLSFVRQRYGLPQGDIDRITRQQVFMSGLARKVLSTGTLTNPAALNNLIAAVERSVTLDSGWDLKAMITQLQRIQGSDIQFATIPVVTIAGVGDNGESVVEVDVAEVHRFFTSVLGNETANPESLIDSAISAKIYNASPIDGAAQTVADQLTALGVVVTEVGNLPPHLDPSGRVVASPNSDKAQEIADILGLPLDLDESYQENSIVVVVNPVLDPVLDPVVENPVEPDSVLSAGGEGPLCVN